jgi:predicted NodU family carbamoyl transferase
MSDLLMTLGHNSSAIVAEENRLVVGYETERITLKKSDSMFPNPVLMRLSDIGRNSFDTAYVTHWAPSGHVDDMAEKYWDRARLQKKVGKIISQEDVGLSHHDTHAYAAIAFAGPMFPSHADDATYLAVVDGFGNNAEHISIYQVIDGVPKLKQRTFGYDTSIGLMYQYATNFLGMKMHEDEYKLLGYQSRLHILNDGQLERLHDVIWNQHRDWVGDIDGMPKPYSWDLATLPQIQSMWVNRFGRLLNDLSITNPHGLEARVAIAHLVQSLTEANVLHIIKRYQPRNLIVSGGVFMNVGLNAALVKNVPNRFCAYPLAGDQGNAIGLRFAVTGLYGDSDLRIGARRSTTTYSQDLDIPAGFMIMEANEQAVSTVQEALNSVGFINIVRGAMEFGPRALCNTSTLARANNLSIVSTINEINGRNTVMPFAPVMDSLAFAKYFEHHDKIWRSDEYMITALECKPNWQFEGAALRTYDNRLTARPQVIRRRDALLTPLLDEHEVLINTSFNVHGVPIVMDLHDAIASHVFQLKRNPNVKTIYIES